MFCWELQSLHALIMELRELLLVRRVPHKDIRDREFSFDNLQVTLLHFLPHILRAPAVDADRCLRANTSTPVALAATEAGRLPAGVASIFPL